MSLIICNNCGRTGHIDKECRQWPSNELRGPSDHTDYAGQGSRANIGRQGMSLDSREPGSDTSNAVSRRNGHFGKRKSGIDVQPVYSPDQETLSCALNCQERLREVKFNINPCESPVKSELDTISLHVNTSDAT